jgi:hypothetical protein
MQRASRAGPQTHLAVLEYGIPKLTHEDAVHSDTFMQSMGAGGEWIACQRERYHNQVPYE